MLSVWASSSNKTWLSNRKEKKNEQITHRIVRRKKLVKPRLDSPADRHDNPKLYAELLAAAVQNHITIEKIIVPMPIEFVQGHKGFQNGKKLPNYSITRDLKG